MADEVEQTSGKHGSSRTCWIPKDTKLFIDILLEYKRNGEMRNNNFGKSWTKICKEYNAKAECKMNQDQLTQKFHRFRSEWRTFSELCGYTGLGWDSANATVVASDEQWIDLIKKNKEFKKFRQNGLEYNKELTEIFQKSTSVGGSAFAPSRSQVDESFGVDTNNPNDFVSLDDDIDEIHETSKSSGKRPVSNGTNEGSKAKKASKSSFKEDLYLEAATQSCILKAQKYSMQLSRSVDEFSSEKCMEALYELEDEVEDDLFIKETQSFMDPNWRPLFLKMNRRHRLAWIRSL